MKYLITTLLLFTVFAGCTQNPEIGYIYWTISDSAELSRSPLENTRVEKITSEAIGRGVSLDLINNKIYWITDGYGSIRRSNLDGSQQETLITFVGRARGIILDTSSDKMYWLENTKLRRANMDGKNPEDLITGLGYIRALDLDLVSGHAYIYADGLFRSDLDGFNFVNILPNNFDANLNSISVDGVHGKIYYTSASVNKGMRRSDLNGNNVETLINDTSVSVVKVLGSKIYFKRDNIESHIYSANLDGTNQQVFYQSIDGYILGNYDIDSNASKIYFDTNRGDLLIQTDLSGENPLSIMATIGEKVHDVAVSKNGKQLFFASQFNGNNYYESIRISNSGGQEIFQPEADSSYVGKIRGIAYDDASNKVYWVDSESSSMGAIKSMNADGTNFTVVVSGLNKPHDITLNLIDGKMYWTENIGSGDTLTAKIRSSDLDGNNVVDVIVGLPQGIRDIAVDVATHLLYFTDQSNDNIMSVNTNGNDLTTIISAVDPHGIAVDNKTGTLYWSEGIGENDVFTAKIRKSDLDGNNASDVFTGINAYIRDITLVYIEDRLFFNGFETP